MILQCNIRDLSPFSLVLRLPRQALLPPVKLQVFDGTDPVDLTGGAVTFWLEDEHGRLILGANPAALENAAQGIVRYDWVEGDTDETGRYFGQFEISISGKSYVLPDNDTQRLIIEITERIE